ncbi:MAG: zinc carboxypeptidase, partial [Nitrosomonas sp.]|nr:zinc carboxypeptidase [Nitrosomonas sp.]
MHGTSTLNRLLPELRQIEAIIQQDNATHLCSKVLCHVSCDNGLLPVYALTLGNNAANIPCVTYVAGI